MTRREFLGLYLFNRPKTLPEKEQNAETSALAEVIRAKRQIELQAGASGFLSKTRRNICFVSYFEQLAATHSGTNKAVWESALFYLRDFTGGQLKFSELTEKKCNDFREHMLSAPKRRSDQMLSINSAVGYFSKFKAALRQAHKDGLLATDLNAKVDAIKSEEGHREYLTLQELQTLARTDCSAMPVLKQAALFSALTGLRYSDIEALTWGQIRHDPARGYIIHFT